MWTKSFSRLLKVSKIWKVATNWEKQVHYFWLLLFSASWLPWKELLFLLLYPFIMISPPKQAWKWRSPLTTDCSTHPPLSLCSVFSMVVKELKTTVLGCYFLYSEYFIDFLLILFLLFLCYLYPIWISLTSWLIFQSLYNIYFLISIQHN